MDLGIKESCALMMIAAFIHFIVKSVLKTKMFNQDRVTELDYSNPQSSAELSEDNKTPHSTPENEDNSNETTSSDEMTDVENANKSSLDNEPHSEGDLKFSEPSLTREASENCLKLTANNSLIDHEPHARINQGSFEILNPTEDRMNYSEENFTSNALQTSLNPVNSAESSDDNKIPNEEMFDVTAINNSLQSHQPGLESALNLGERNITSKLLGNNITLTLDSEARLLRSVTSNEEDSNVSQPTNIDILISAESSLEVADTAISLQQVTSNEKDSIDISIPTDSDTQCDIFQLSMKTYETLVQLIRIGAETVNVSRSMTQAALVVNEISEFTIESPKIVVNSTLIETFKKLVKTCAESEELVHEGLKLNLDILNSHVNLLDARLTTFESLQETIRTALSICRQLTQSIGNSDDIGTVVRNVLYYLNQQILASEPTVDIKTVTSLETDSCEMEIRNMFSTSPDPEWSNDSFQNLTETEPTVVIDNFCDYFRGLEGKFRSCLDVLEKQVCQIAKTIEEMNILLFDNNLHDSMDEGCKHSSDCESPSIVLQMSPQLNGISEYITNEELNVCYLKSSERLTSNLFVTESAEEILQVSTIPVKTGTNVLRNSEIKMLEDEQVNIHSKVEDTTKVESKYKSCDRLSDLKTLSISHQLFPQLDETSGPTKEKFNTVFLKASEDLTSSLFVTDIKEEIQQIGAVPAKITGEVLQIPVTKRNADSLKTSENLTSDFISVENSETLKFAAIPAEVTDDVSQLVTDKKISGNGLKSSEDMTSGLVAIEISEETLQVDAVSEEITDVVLQVTETKMNVNVLESSDESTSGQFAKENSEEILNAVAIPVDAIQQVVESKMLDDEQEVFDVHFKDEFSGYALDTVPMEFIYPCLPYFIS